MPAWARIVTALAALRVAAALAIYWSGNSVPPPDAPVPPVPLAVYAVLCLAFALVGAMLVTANRNDVRAAWLGGVLLLLAVPLTSALLMRVRELDGVRLDSFLPAFLFAFVAVFPSPLRGRSLALIRAAAAVCAVVAGFIAAVTLSRLFVDVVPATGDWRETFAAGREMRASFYWLLVLVPSVMAFVSLAVRMIASTGSDRFRSRVFVGGLLAGVAPLLMQVIAEQAIPGFTALAHRPGVEPIVASILFGAFGSIPLITAYSVLYDRVVELRIALRVAVQYALARYVVLAGTLVPIAALSIYLYQRRAESLADLFAGARPLLLSAGVIAGAVTLRTRDRVLRALDRRYFREEYDTRDLIASILSDELLSGEPRSIAAGLAQAVDRSMHADADLYVLDEDGAALIDPAGRQRPLRSSSTLSALATADVKPMDIDLSSDSSLARLPADERAWIEQRRYTLLVALRARSGGLIGLVAFGPKRSGLGFTPSERLAISAFAAPLATALENERLRRVPVSEGPPAAECPNCSRVLDRDATACQCGGALVAASAPRLLRGVYRLDRRIGSGGMGVVYRGLDLSLNRDVAIKTLPRTSDENAARLRREAHAMASLTHPHLAIIFGLETWRGVPFLVQEYLAGGTLADRLKSGPLPLAEALDQVLALADVLIHVHANGIVHCDVKPSNIGFSHTGTVKLLDFGLAHLLRGDQATHTTIGSGTAARPATSLIVTDRGVMGTPPYMCPEAIHAMRPASAFDLWALAVVLYEAIAGRRPFVGTTAGEVFLSIETGSFVPLVTVRPDCPDGVSTFVDRALSKDIRLRPPDARAMREELLRLRALIR